MGSISVPNQTRSSGMGDKPVALGRRVDENGYGEVVSSPCLCLLPWINNYQMIARVKPPHRSNIRELIVAAEPIISEVCCDASVSKAHTVCTRLTVKSTAPNKVTKKPPTLLSNKRIYVYRTGANRGLLT